MGLLQKLKEGFSKDKGQFKQRFKEVQEEKRIMDLVEERSKSSNQRELEKHFNDKREAQMKEQLDHIRKQRTKENWKSDKPILTKGSDIMKTDRPILKEKNIFSHNKSMGFMGKGGMFFK